MAMRKRLNIDAIPARNRGVNHLTAAAASAAITFSVSVVRRNRGPKKKNPAVGTPGQTFVVIGVYGFKYAAWLPFLPPVSGESVLFFFFSQYFFLVLLLSCSSLTFLNLTEPFANSHRFLSVCALTRPWVGTR
jgi:hypothetical protein